METNVFEINERERQVVVAALSALENEHSQTGFSGDRATIDRLRKILTASMAEVPHPDHVVFRTQEFRNLMMVLPAALSWRLALRSEGESYAMVAVIEPEDEEAAWTFELAHGLKGTGGFLELADADLEFFRRIEGTIRDKAPSNVAQIVHEIVEIALPWDFMPDDETDARLVEYLIANKGDNDEDVYIPGIHSTLLDEHSDQQLDMLGYASVLTEISWNENEIDEIKEFIARLNEEARVGPSRSM